MIHLPRSLHAWGSSDFKDVLKREIEQLDVQELPLQHGLTGSSHVTDQPFQVMILSVNEEAGLIHVNAGIFYTGVIAGCNCADDPSPVDEQNEYCTVRFDINRMTAHATVALLVE
jgi:hypothetical protein